MSLQGTTTLPSVALTPYRRMRKKRPSLSPAKKTEFDTPAPREYSSNPSTAQKVPELSSSDNEALDTGLASLQFEEFSWDDGKGDYNSASSNHLCGVIYYLRMLFPEAEVTMADERVPYLLIWCTGSVPEPSRRPFLIAGLLGVWLVDGPDQYPIDLIDIESGVFELELNVDDDLIGDIRRFHIPKTKTMCQIVSRYFPDALALSFFDNNCLVELPELPMEGHKKRLMTLPSGFVHCRKLLLRYHNGLRINGHENKRLKNPEPEKVDGQCDDTDYVASQGIFQPGSMLAADNGNTISAGILVEKGDKRRLTVAFHCWQDELDKNPEKMGDPQFFRVTQGNTHVGHVSSRLGVTDIGLATLNDNVEFCNRFLDIPGGPTRLLSSDELEYDDIYAIDSYTTGRQGKLLCKGKRIILPEGKERRTDRYLIGNPKDLPGEGVYVRLVQGIYATSAPEAHGQPIIREGCCGSAVVRLDEKKSMTDEPSSSGVKGAPVIGTSTQEKTPTGFAGLHAKSIDWKFANSGEVSGFMHWSDHRDKNSAPNPRLFCYADAADPLVEDSWKVVKTAEKRKHDGSEDPFMD